MKHYCAKPSECCSSFASRPENSAAGVVDAMNFKYLCDVSHCMGERLCTISYCLLVHVLQAHANCFIYSAVIFLSQDTVLEA